jgi:hypothetical protein
VGFESRARQSGESDEVVSITELHGPEPKAVDPEMRANAFDLPDWRTICRFERNF